MARRTIFKSKSPRPASREVRKGGEVVMYRQLESTFDAAVLFQFNNTFGNAIERRANSDAAVQFREHLAQLATGETIVWGAFSENNAELCGFISAELGGGYWLQTKHGKDATCFVKQLVVSPEFGGRGIGTNLIRFLAVEMFAPGTDVKELFTTVHVDNIASRTAFLKAGYEEAITYTDDARDRDTTVLKYANPSNSVSDKPRSKSLIANKWIIVIALVALLWQYQKLSDQQAGPTTTLIIDNERLEVMLEQSQDKLKKLEAEHRKAATFYYHQEHEAQESIQMAEARLADLKEAHAEELARKDQECQAAITRVRL